MGVPTKRPEDARSTGRKRGRKALEESGRPYKCECGEKHDWHLGVDQCNYTPQKQSRSDTLDVNHRNKNILDNNPANLEWLCRRCHKAIDSRTEKGVMHEESWGELYGELEGGYLYVDQKSGDLYTLWD